MVASRELIEKDILAYLRAREHQDLLRFITCGSVDDGKSTLIGRILYDSGNVFEDHLEALKRDSARLGTTGGDLDLAFLVDGLQSEREQGITIDVAYRYFSTERRKFIIADCPGHEQYTRNMATGASTANLAVILIDARKGVLTQTRRHSFICSLLGIRHAIIAVNKMDLVGYDRATFERIRDEYLQFARSLDLPDIRFVPLSALAGDNVVHPSANMPWYQGQTLLEILETIEIAADRNFRDLRLPVQYVNRPHLDFRGFCGTLASGVVRRGDAITVLPSRRTSRVKSILTGDTEVSEAYAPMAVTITLEDEIDVSRGDLIVHPERAPHVGNVFNAHIVWLAEAPLLTGKQYLIKLATRLVSGSVETIHHEIDVNTQEHHPAEELRLNQIAECRVVLNEAVAFDPYAVSPGTGAFILIDRLSNATVGAGMIARTVGEPIADRAVNVVWHAHRVSKTQRANQKGQRPCVIWFTGLSGSGKSTIANALEQALFRRGYHSYLLDGDNIRHGLNKDLDFSDAGRIENIRRIGEVARLFVDAGLIVITAFISPFRSDRQLVRELVESGEFIEVFVDTPLEVCEQRDTKGLYRRARAGEIRNFTGIDSPYEPPEAPEIVLDTVKLSVDECVASLMRYLDSKGFLRN
ncbi:MAG TPA: sulfate adenylyltransferase subunit CysN [Gammaproteobacteria bacterium]|nr:sulfate adenylyltransferase subunit CysN [Gammaproteobacteria bacterium]